MSEHLAGMTYRDYIGCTCDVAHDLGDDSFIIEVRDPLCVHHGDMAQRLAEAVALLREVEEHIEDLEEAWRRGSISEHDDFGGLRSNRNARLNRRIHGFLAEVSP